MAPLFSVSRLHPICSGGSPARPASLHRLHVHPPRRLRQRRPEGEGSAHGGHQRHQEDRQGEEGDDGDESDDEDEEEEGR